MTKGIHRIPANSPAGRRMTHAKGRQESSTAHLTPEQKAWNEAYERRRNALIRDAADGDPGEANEVYLPKGK